MTWKDIEEYAVNTLIMMTCMTAGWLVCYVGLGILGVR